MPGRPTIPRSSRHRCSRSLRPRARPSLHSPRRRRRRDLRRRSPVLSVPSPLVGEGSLSSSAHLTISDIFMTYPGEQFYPAGVNWSDPIERGTLPDLLSTAAAEFGARPVLEFRDRPTSFSELEAMVETAAAA